MSKYFVLFGRGYAAMMSEEKENFYTSHRIFFCALAKQLMSIFAYANEDLQIYTFFGSVRGREGGRSVDDDERAIKVVSKDARIHVE